jgi:hypothetical protein
MRDKTDNWNYPQLRTFQACPIVNARRVEYLARQLGDGIDEQKAREFAEHKKALKEQIPSEPDEPAIKPQDTSIIAKVTPDRRQEEQDRASPAARPCLARLAISRAKSDSDDAFRRNHADIKPFVRAFYRQYKAFPTTEETLDWLKANGRYSGDGDERASKRAKRVQQILHFTKQTFDSSKISKGQVAVHLNLGRFSWWVRQHFGSRMTARSADIHRFDPETMTAPIREVDVPARFIGTFLAVAEFCLKQDPLGNKAVPTNRIKKIWEMVEGGASWNQRYYQLVRDRLHRLGVIRITDRNHYPGKAWTWEVGQNFPADSWKEEQRILKGRLPSSDPGDRIICNGREKVHNTLYQDAQQNHRSCCVVPLVRPPP